MREVSDRRRTEPPEPEAVPPRPAEEHPLLALQSAVGNAQVSRMVEDLLEAGQARETDVPPHEPGDASADLLALGPGAFGTPGEAEPEAEGVDLADVRVDAAPAEGQQQQQPQRTQGKPAVVPDPALVRWAAARPATDKDMAAWLLEGETHEFVKFWPFYRQQLEDIAAGKDTVNMYVERDKKGNSKTARRAFRAGKGPLPVLTFLVGLTRARADRWLDDTSLDKTFVEAGELIRRLPKDAHHTGGAADLFPHFDWNGANGPAQVIQVLDDLPAGNYLIGLPMQGQFFPKPEYLAERQAKSIADAGPGGTPADVKQPSLIYWKDAFYTSKYDASKGKYPWVDSYAGKGVVDRLRSAALKTELAALAGKGKRIGVFPDFDNHIHIQAD